MRNPKTPVLVSLIKIRHLIKFFKNFGPSEQNGTFRFWRQIFHQKPENLLSSESRRNLTIYWYFPIHFLWHM